MTLPVVFTANGPSGYNLTKSLRFRSSASAYLNKTFSSSPTDAKKITISVWFKRGNLATGVDSQIIMSGYDNSSTRGAQLVFADAADNFYFEFGGSAIYRLGTNQVFRDPSAWYHIVAVADTTQATDTNRLKLYVNGVQVTSFSTTSYPPQNATGQFLYSSAYNRIGSNFNSTAGFFSGYLAEMNVIDGQALTPSSFGSTNATTGVWQPAKYTGTYGTNGFYLPFTNTTSTTTLGYDFSGNSNNWTTNNISLTTGSTYDSMTDVPTLTSATTANYSVINPLMGRDGIASQVTISNGNLTATHTPSAYGTFAWSSFAVSSGKYYMEINVTSLVGGASIGIDNGATVSGNYNYCAWYQSGGNKYVFGSSSAYGSSWTTGDVIGIALDMTAGTVTFYKNNVSQGVAATGLTGNYFIQVVSDTGSVYNWNFGQRGFTYTPPTGFVALNTFNLPTSTIVQGNKYMDATLYTGNATITNISNSSGTLYPDFLWIKARSSATDNILANSNVGVQNFLVSNSTGAEQNDSRVIRSVTSGSFQLGTDAGTSGSNQNGVTYVGWQWQAGQGTTSSNTNGSITSTVSVNASAGFSVVTFNSTSASGTSTIGHGLGVKPSMLIMKDRTSAYGWDVWNKGLGAISNTLILQSTAAVSTTRQPFTTTEPTSTVFSFNNTFYAVSNDNIVVYAWAEIAGFSKFGSYTGNGSTDGTFIYTGFRPKFILFKCTSTTENWVIIDSSRDSYNVASDRLYPNTSGAEDTGAAVLDIVSNGFKQRNSAASGNISGQTYIYAAFAENPFKNALAR